MKIRDTVISEEQERILLERILSEEENESDDVSDHVIYTCYHVISPHACVYPFSVRIFLEILH